MVEPKHIDHYVDPNGKAIQVTLHSLSPWQWQLEIKRGEELPIVTLIDTAGHRDPLFVFAVAHMRVGEQMKRWAHMETAGQTQLMQHLTHYIRQLMKLPPLETEL